MSAFSDIVRELHVAENPPQARDRPEIEEVTTPSGLEIRYTEKKHLYFTRESGDPPTEWRQVPSVSTVLKCLDKPALPWWGMKIGVAGVLELVREHGLRPELSSVDEIVGVPGSKVKGLLTQHKLTVNHVRDAAGDRGVTVHDALEDFYVHAALPNPELWPESQRGYVTALLDFLRTVDFEPEATECIVASHPNAHGYAGRYDVRGRILKPVEVRVYADRYDPAKDVFATIPAGRYLNDLKTAKDVFLEHFLQLEGYEGASVECGYEETDVRGVLNVLADGRYQFVRSPATHADFLAVLACHNAISALKDRAA
jgi:hypothetical protein